MIVFDATETFLFLDPEEKKVVPAEEALVVLDALNERGYQLSVACNWDARLNDLLRNLGLLSSFQSVISSTELGVELPSPDFFKAVLEDLDSPADKTLFVGTSIERSLDAAAAVGLKMILLDPDHTEVKKTLSDSEKKSLHEDKVVSLESLKQNRRLSGVKVIAKFSELLDICK